MWKSLIIVASLFPAPLAVPADAVLDTLRPPSTHPSIAVHAPIRLSMGPDPGGKTGATVNPETTTNGSPSADSAMIPNSTGAARNRAQGANESSYPANSGGRSERSSTDNSAGDSEKRSQSPSRVDTEPLKR
jgi:hypothetical protein